MARVKLENLCKSFGSTEVIRNIDLDITEGEFVVFVGPSGCGKSTLLRLIAGLEEASSGAIWIGNNDVTRMAPAKRGVSMVFQSYALYPHMDAYRNIAFGLKVSDAAGDTVDQRVHKVSEMLQITDLLHRRPRELSGGQRQRVAIARAIVRQPQVFLFDEPLSNLDAALRTKTRLEIARLHDELGSTMIFVTHDQLEAMTLASRIILLNNGRVEQAGTPADLYRRPATRFAAEFIGTPTMNMLRAHIEGGQATLSSGERLAMPTRYHGAADIGIRPESISQVSSSEPDTLQARVLHVEELGEARVIHASLSDGTSLTLRDTADAPRPDKGSTVALRLDPQRLHFFAPDGARIEQRGSLEKQPDEP